MKPIAIALVLLATAAPGQDEMEKKVAELAKGLVEEDLEAQDRAAQELANLGPAAIPAIRKQAEKSEGDARARLLSIVTEIDRRERLKEYLAGPTLVTLKADKKPLREILDELKRHAKTKVINSSGVKDAAITVDLDKVPFFEALDRICRAHGGLVLRLPMSSWTSGSMDEGVRLAKGDPTRIPHVIDGAFAIELANLQLTETSDFGGTATEELRLEFHAASEKGNRPTSAKLKLTSLVDEAGTSYLDTVAKGNDWSGGWQHVPSTFTVTASKVPPHGVKALKEIAGVLEMEFPSDIEVVKIDAPVGKTGAEAKGETISFKIIEFTKTAGGYKVVLEAPADADLWNRDISIMDSKGRKHRSNGWSGSGDGKSMKVDMTFSLPDAVEVADLRITNPKPGAQKKIEFSFKNVRVR